MKKVWVMINKTLLKIIVLFPLFFILSCSNNSNDQVMEKVGAQIDSGFELPNLDGQEVNISNYKGKYSYMDNKLCPNGLWNGGYYGSPWT